MVSDKPDKKKEQEQLLMAQKWQENQSEFVKRIWGRLNTALMDTQEEMEKEGLTVDPIFAPVSMQAFIAEWVKSHIQPQAVLAVFDDLVTGFARHIGIETFKDDEDEPTDKTKIH